MSKSDKTKTQMGREMVEGKVLLLDPMKLFCCSPRFLDDHDLGTAMSCVFQACEKTLKAELRLPGFFFLHKSNNGPWPYR